MAEQRRGSRSSGDIEPHPLVEALASDPSKPPTRATRLAGLPGRAADDTAVRLWLDADLTSFVDVPKDAIRHSQKLPDDQGTILWVDPEATLSYSSVQAHDVQASFLSGAISQQYLAGAAAGAPVPGPAPPAPQTIACPSLDICPSVEVCPTRVPVCTHVTPCGATQVAPCPTHTVSVCVICPTRQETVCLVCPTRQVSVCVICPTHEQSVCFVCPTRQVSVCVICPTHQQSVCVVCPTRQVSVCLICPTHTPICQPTHLCTIAVGCGKSVDIPCQSVPACPTAFCPQSIGCGPDFGPEGGQGPIG
jgi:hypothetical protein